MRKSLTFACLELHNRLKPAFSVCLKDLTVIFVKMRIFYTIDSIWIQVGENFDVKDWIIYLSSRTTLLSELIEKIVPALLESGVPFRVVKNEQEAYNINAGVYGMHMVGKVIQVAPRSEAEAVSLSDKLREVSRGFKGCLIQDSIRLGDIVYVQKLSGDPLRGKILKTTFPFFIEKEYKKTPVRRIIGKYYIPFTVLSRNCKGVTYIGLNLRSPFKWCLIKQGNVNAADDHFGRDIRDRLHWQMKVLKELEGASITSQAYGLAEYKDFYFLIMEYIDGEPLSQVISNIRKGRSWSDLSAAERSGILQVYLKTLEKVNSLHERGYVHRDIVGRNLIVKKSGDIRLIDFEMSCDIKSGLPSPPFTLGTFGYIAPEQLNHMEPDFPEDVYSIGALLLNLLTGKEPVEVISNDYGQTKQAVHELVREPELRSIILEMLMLSPGDRPGMKSIMNTISNYIALLNNGR